jgi:hypothetical protein
VYSTINDFDLLKHEEDIFTNSRYNWVDISHPIVRLFRWTLRPSARTTKIAWLGPPETRGEPARSSGKERHDLDMSPLSGEFSFNRNRWLRNEEDGGLSDAKKLPILAAWRSWMVEPPMISST